MEERQDLISRQAAIEAVETKIKKWNAVDGEGYHVGLGLRYTDVIDTLTELPSAQPEIRCRDCKHCVREDYDVHTPYRFYDTVISAFCDLHWDCKEGEYRDINLDDYCAWAERRADGSD